MKRNSAAESGLFNPRVFLALTLGSIGAMLAMFSFASTPSSGTLTDTSGPISFTSGPFTAANPTPVIEVDSGPECNGSLQPCDDFALTVTLPSGYHTNHPNASIKVTMSWTDTGTGASDYDLYIYKIPRSDCNPTDCTTTNGSQAADYQSATSNNPEVATISPLSDGTQKYTVVVVPFTPTGETVHVTIELLPGSGSAGSTAFGGPDPTTPGVPRYQNFFAPNGTSAQSSSGEFNIGFNPHTGRIMTMNSGPIWRLTPPELLSPAKPECCDALWEDKSNTTTDTGLDPILWTDQKTGRTLVSNSTVGANAVYGYSDNDGDSWVPLGIAAPNGGADHETIGSGPYPASLSALSTAQNQGEAVYYCSQDIVGPAACYRSDTLGASYGPSVLAYTGQGSGVPGGTCGGLHGHIHVAPDGTAWLPVNQCSGLQGGVFSTDGGVTWNTFQVPNAISQAQGADPSIAIDSDSTIYYAYVNNEPVAPGNPPEGHARVQVGHRNADNTISWTNNFDLGATHGIVNAAEIEAVGGTSGRAGVGFLGTNVAGDYQAISFPGKWYAFIATTYDGGKSWVTVNATPNDPVQSMTGIWQQGGNHQDRNLLDFNEITVDAKGRVLYGYSDGCVSEGCIGGTAPNDFVAWMRVARQSGGKTLFASNDNSTDTTTATLPKPPCLSGTRDVTASHLTWKAPDNGGANIVGYQILRGTTSGGESVIITNSLSTRTSFDDATADPSVPDYFYTVKAINSVGVGTQSNEIDLKVGPSPVTPPAYSCDGVDVVLDATGDARNPAGLGGPTSQADITAISFAANSPATAITTKMTLANLTSTPSPGTTFTTYFVVWTSSDGKTYATETDVSPGPLVAFNWGEFDTANNQLKTFNSTTGTFNQGVNGTITVDVPISGVGNPTIPITDVNGTAAVTNPYGLTIAGEGAVGSGLVFTSPMDRAPDTGFGQRWAVCPPPNAAPTAVLNATPSSGAVPLTVNFDGSGSSDSDGDTIASYTFDFGDGGAPVTQSTPTISHTYQFAGNYAARLTVTDSDGLQSLNTATDIISVSPAQVSQITPAGASCSQFASGTASTLSSVQYAVKSGTISQTNPGVFSYWVKVTAVKGKNTFLINQSITTNNFRTLLHLASSGSNVYDSNCSSQHPTITQSGTTNTTSDIVTVTWTAAQAGTYYISLKFNTTSIDGQSAPASTTTIHYSYSTTNLTTNSSTDVSGSTSGIDFVKK
jgi:PKD repeat protein